MGLLSWGLSFWVEIKNFIFWFLELRENCWWQVNWVGGLPEVFQGRSQGSVEIKQSLCSAFLKKGKKLKEKITLQLDVTFKWIGWQFN